MLAHHGLAHGLQRPCTLALQTKRPQQPDQRLLLRRGNIFHIGISLNKRLPGLYDVDCFRLHKKQFGE
jgi:hypothetical protein